MSHLELELLDTEILGSEGEYHWQIVDNWNGESHESEGYFLTKEEAQQDMQDYISTL